MVGIRLRTVLSSRYSTAEEESKLFSATRGGGAVDWMDARASRVVDGDTGTQRRPWVCDAHARACTLYSTVHCTWLFWNLGMATHLCDVSR